VIDVLIVSEQAERAAHVEQLLVAGALAGRVVRLRGQAWQTSPGLQLNEVDVVLAIHERPQAELFVQLERLLDHAPQAAGILLCGAPLANEDMLAAMRIGVRYVQSWPLDEAALAQELRAIEQKKRSSRTREGRVLTFLSSQGGSGTTLVATQIAHACAAVLRRKVLIIDADRQYADAQLFLTPDLHATTLLEIAAQVDRLDSALFDAGIARLGDRLDLLVGAGDPVKAAQVQPDQLARILQFARPRYDLVVVDAGHHLDAATITLLDHSTDIFLVLRQSLPDLYAVKRLTGILQELGYSTEKIQALVNQFDPSAKLGLDMLRDSLPGKQVHSFPRDEKLVRKASDLGLPLRELAPRSGLVRAIEQFVLRHWDTAQPAGKVRWWPWRRPATAGGDRSSNRPARD
jgi:pilus assembly protein CpaE